MKKLVLFLICFCSFADCLFSDDFYDLFFCKIGEGGLLYSSDMHKGFSPRDPSFYDGETVFFPQIKNGILIRLAKISPGFEVTPMPYPEDLVSKLDWGSNFCFGEKSLVFIRANPNFCVFEEDTRTVLTHVRFKDIAIQGDHTYPVYHNGVYFLYCKDEKVRGITREGIFLETEGIISMLSQWAQDTWYPSEEMRAKHLELIASGQYLILDGVFYPFKVKQAKTYFKECGYHWQIDEFNDEQSRRSFTPNQTFYSISLNGEMHMNINTFIYTFDQKGRMLSRKKSHNARFYEAQKKGAVYNFTSFQYLFHKNGDIYRFQTVENEGMYAAFVKRTWGTDYIALARTGVKPGTEKKNTELVQSFNNPELRIVKAALFAPMGWVPENRELHDYFLGYDWYQGNPEVKADPALLNADQRQLYDIIVAEEKRRGW